MIKLKNFVPSLKLHTHYVFQSKRFCCTIIAMYCCDRALGEQYIHVLLTLFINCQSKLECQHTI